MTSSDAKYAELTSLLAVLCDGDMDQRQCDRLETLLIDDPKSQDFYRRFIVLDVDLAWRAAGGESAIGGGPSPANDKSEIRNPELDASGPQSTLSDHSPLFPPIIIDSSAPTSPLLTLHSSVGGFLFSYTMSALIVGIALLIGWTWKIHYDGQVARDVPRQVPLIDRETPLVGRISGMADCRWADPTTATAVEEPVALGRKYSLASGFLEITYQSGAKVILEGPVTYEVESARSGYLSLGKLTARVESRESRVESRESRGERTVNPTLSGHQPKVGREMQPTASLAPRPSSSTAADSRLSTLDSGLFCIRTPTAIVTDLGTEFGVEVDRMGATKSHVFRGKVELWVGGGSLPLRAEGRDNRGGRVIELIENESVTVEPRPNRAAKVVHETSQPSATTFIRELPQGTPIQVFSTGVGLPIGARDPHWQLQAWKSDEPPHVFEFRPVWPSEVIDPPASYLANDPSRSQWLKADGQFARHGLARHGMPEGVASFRTTFELPKRWSGSAVLRGGFIADQRVVGLWLNRTSVPVPEHGDPVSFDRFYPFVVREGFVAGTNVLIFEVRTKPVKADGPLPTEPLMSLRVELRGYEVRGPPVRAANAADGKEQRPTK